MRKYLYGFIIAACAMPLSMQAQVEINETNFPDENFRTFVSGADIDKDQDGVLSANELTVKSINVEKKSIAKLDGIEFFTELTDLRCSQNSLTTLDLSANTKLTLVYCDRNSLTSLNVEGCTALKTLWCQTNKLTSVTVASPALTLFYANNNELTSVDITGCPALKELRLYRNPDLAEVDFSGNSKMEKLEIFSCALNSIDVSNMSVLYWLSASDNNISEIDVTNNPKLTNLVLGNNNLSELDLSQNPLMKTLRFEDNNISEIDVAHLTELSYFTCGNNNLTELDVTNSPKLATFRCEGNQLTQLDVTKNPALVHFQCDDNQLTTLDLSNNTKLGLVHNPGVGKYYKISPQETVIDAVVVGDNREKVAIPLVLSSEKSTMDASQFSKCIIGVNQTFTAGVVDNNLVVKDDPQEDVDLYGAKVSYTYTVPCGTNAATTAQKAMQVKVTTYPYVMYVNPLSQDTQDGFFSGTLIVDYDAVVPEGAEAYVATAIALDREGMTKEGEHVTSEQLTMTKIGEAGDVIPANTPIYVKAADASGMYAFGRNKDEVEPVAVPSGNILQGTMTKMTVEPKSVLTLGRETVFGTGYVGFWTFQGTEIPAHRVYVDAALLGEENGANGFTLNFEGGSDGISAASTDAAVKTDNTWYSLQGVRMQGVPAVKGVYINNGKKVVVK